MVKGVGAVVLMSDLNFDPSCLSWHILNRIEEGWLTEPVELFIGHYIYYETLSFLFNSVLYFPHNNHMVKEEKGKYV